MDIAGEGPAQQVHRLARHLHAAADLMDEGYHAIDIGIIGKPLFIEVIGSLAGSRGAAVSDDEDADMVARRDIAVVADDALEGGAADCGFDVASGHAAAFPQHLFLPVGGMIDIGSMRV